MRHYKLPKDPKAFLEGIDGYMSGFYEDVRECLNDTIWEQWGGMLLHEKEVDIIREIDLPVLYTGPTVLGKIFWKYPQIPEALNRLHLNETFCDVLVTADQTRVLLIDIDRIKAKRQDRTLLVFKGILNEIRPPIN